MGSRRRRTPSSRSTLRSSELSCASDLFRNYEEASEFLSIKKGTTEERGHFNSPSDHNIGEKGVEDCSIGRRKLDHAKCTSSTRRHNSRNYFSLVNGLILILILLLCWSTCCVLGGFPGRGPPVPPRGPPLLPHHPLAGNPFNRRRPPPPHYHHHHGPPPPPRGRHPHPPHHHASPKSSGGDLSVAAQTLYDLRGYQFSGPENPRYHRQNDPFTLPTPLAPNPRANAAAQTSHHHRSHLSQDTRTAPLVFPSFYQEQPTPTPTRSSIFGHNQHLSQTRFEPPPGFHLGGNSASGKITLEQQSASTRDQFRPSQIDISLHGNQVTPSPAPTIQFGTQSSTLAPEKKLLTSTSRPRPTVKLRKNQHDPFVYVYDEVDYDEGDDDFVLGGRHRTPQGQINNNRITPSTSTTTVAPLLRQREPTIVPQFPALQYHQPQQSPLHHQPLFTSTTTKPPTTTQNSLFYSPQKDEFRDPFRDTGIIRPPITPRPNVEIVPSSERKPPPDQSNAIAPALQRFPQNTIRDFGRAPQQPQIPLVSDVVADLRSRRPVTTTTTTLAPPTNALVPQYQFPIQQFPHHHQQQQQQLHHQQFQFQQPQGRQVNSVHPSNPIPYFPAGLDRRPFETGNEIPSVQTKNQFDQVVNLLQEEEEEEYNQNNGVNNGPNLLEQGFQNPSKLRPVNTIIPKNRIPKEDIVLPPNFPFTHAQDNILTTPLSPTGQGNKIRGDTTQRLREQTTRIREELPRNVPTSAPLDENLINQHHSQVTPAPGRQRGRQQQQQLRPTTTAVPSGDAPQRTRGSARQRLRPNYRQSTTTTTTSTTTPTPSYVEYPSQEYIDDYDNNNNQQYQQSPPPVVPQQQPKSLSRFPPFPNKKKEQEVSTVSPVQLQRQRPTLAGGRQRPGKGNRFRESTTPDSTSPRTTGKPLYTTGKMLSKEGGLYAGQMITSSHIYGHPVPNMPINGILDKMPGVLDGNTVIFATTKPSFGSPQKHLRSKQRYSEHGPPSRINSSTQRLRPNARPSLEGGVDIVETVTLRPYQGSQDDNRSKEEPKRLRAGSQFVRGSGSSSQQSSSTERSQEDGQHVLPRRRKRPGQRRQHQLQQNPFTETVQLQSSSVRPTADDDDSFQTERAQILREPPAIESTTSANNIVTPSPRSRRPRPPRPGKQNNSGDFSNTSERSREDQSQSLQIEEKPAKPVRKLRPRLRPVPTSQLNTQQQQQRGASSEVITQSQSAQIERKPTDAPGRFSSRFREQDNFDSSTVSSLRGDEREVSTTGPSRFSPPTSRLTFKPPLPKKPLPGQRNGKRGPNSSTEPSDELPDSIRLSPKDVIANRKPARRIPPGSASDRLKALQQKRNKVFGSHQHGEEQTAEGRQVPITKRPRLKPAARQQEQDEEQELPQPQKLHRRPSSEATGSKREIVPRAQQKLKGKNELLDYYNEENEQDNLKEDFEDENDDYDEQGISSPAPQQSHFTQAVGKPGGRNNGGFQRNRSVEVTSDEARSVLGIPRPAAPRGLPKKLQRFQKKYQYDDEDVEEEQDEAFQNEEQIPQQQFQEENEEEEQRPRLQSNPTRLKLRQGSKERQQQSRFQQDANEEQPETVLPQKQEGGGRSRQQVSRERQRVSQERFRHQEETQDAEDQEDEQDDYKNDEDNDDIEDREEVPRKPYLKLKQQQQRFSSSNAAPSSFQKVFRNKKLNSAERKNSRERLERDEDRFDEEIIPQSERTTSSSTTSSSTSSSSTSTSTASSSTSSSTSSSPLIDNNQGDDDPSLALAIKQGPQPIKPQGAQGMLGMLKARLRQNRRRLIGQNGKQPRVSVLATTTQATITEESQGHQQSQKRLSSKPKHGTIHVHSNKALRPRQNSGGGGGGGKRNSKKFIAMATENPTLPIESIFPEVP